MRQCKFADYFTGFQKNKYQRKGSGNEIHVISHNKKLFVSWTHSSNINILKRTPLVTEEIAIKTINRYSTISLLRLRFFFYLFLILFLMQCMPLDSKILPCKFSTKTFLTKEQQFAVYSKLYYTYWYSNIGHLLQFELQLKCITQIVKQ